MSCSNRLNQFAKSAQNRWSGYKAYIPPNSQAKSSLLAHQSLPAPTLDTLCRVRAFPLARLSRRTLWWLAAALKKGIR